MLKLKNIHSLSDFQRNTKAHMRRLKKTGEPAVLTVNGQAELVVLTADKFQHMLDDLEMAENLASIHKGMLEAERGEGVPLRDLIRRLRRRNAEGKTK